MKIHVVLVNLVCLLPNLDDRNAFGNRSPFRVTKIFFEILFFFVWKVLVLLATSAGLYWNNVESNCLLLGLIQPWDQEWQDYLTTFVLLQLVVEYYACKVCVLLVLIISIKCLVCCCFVCFFDHFAVKRRLFLYQIYV